MTDTVRKTKRADELAVGDWLDPGELSEDAAEVLFALPFPGEGGTRVQLVARQIGNAEPFTDEVGGATSMDLATDEELTGYRLRAERAQRIADLRKLADLLEANPDVPLPLYPSEQVDLHDDGNVATVRALGEKFGARVRDDLHDRTQVYIKVGSFEYRVIAWHEGGRPAEPELKPWESAAPLADRIAESMVPVDDPTGLTYSREADDTAAEPVPDGVEAVPLTGRTVDDGCE